MQMLRAAGLVTAAVVLFGCNALAPAAPAKQARLPIATSPNPLRLVGVTEGTLRGDQSMSTACLWLDDGVESEALIWPAGYSAAGSPLVVFDAAGRPVATVGQRLLVGGARFSFERGVARGCSGFASFWTVYQTQAVDGPPARAQYRIATRSPGGVNMLARGDAVLQGRANQDGTACFWRAGGEPFVWPAGYTAGGSPLSVMDPLGRVMAVVGWPMLYGGGNGDINSAVLGCPISSEAWFMGEVQQSA